MVLRDGPFFKPDRVDRFDLKPGDSARIEVGWFFEHASRVWENGVDSFYLFNDPGTYRVRSTYRNQWPIGAFHNPDATGNTDYLSVWTGELSDAVEVVITAEQQR